MDWTYPHVCICLISFGLFAEYLKYCKNELQITDAISFNNWYSQILLVRLITEKLYKLKLHEEKVSS